MKKTIVKMKLDGRIGFVTALAEISMQFSDPYWQHDRIFVPKNYDRNKAMPRLSLRTVVKNTNKDASYLLIMRRHFAEKGIDIVNATPVKDYTETAHILYQLGYTLKAEISRRREELVMSDSVKIYVDKIDGLNGYYGKIESDLTDGDSAETARADLIETFKVLGVKHKPVDKTYAELIESAKHESV